MSPYLHFWRCTQFIAHFIWDCNSGKHKFSQDPELCAKYWKYFAFHGKMSQLNTGRVGGEGNKYVFIFTSKTRTDNSDVCFGSCKWGWNLISVCCGTFVCCLSYLLICLQTQSMRVFVVIYIEDDNNEWSKTLRCRHSTPCSRIFNWMSAEL